MQYIPHLRFSYHVIFMFCQHPSSSVLCTISSSVFICHFLWLYCHKCSKMWWWNAWM